MQELDQYYVIETTRDLYVLEDELFDGKVLDGVLELAVRFDSFEQAQAFLNDMKKEQVNGRIRTVQLFISVIEDES